MSTLRMRPRFSRVVPQQPGEILELLGDAFASSSQVIGRVYKRSAVLRVPQSVRHFWSPQLHISVDEEDDGARLVCLFSPHPTVWSFFVALYVAIAFAGVMGVIFGFSQWSLGTDAYALWAGPLAIVLAALVYLAARLGRRFGHDQMHDLHSFVQVTIGTSAPEE